MRAELVLEPGMLYGFLLVLARVAGAFLFVPMPGFRTSPEAPRIVLALSLTMALFPAWPSVSISEPLLGRLTGWLLAEAAFGLTVGLAVAFLAEAFLVGAQILGLQAGYSYASTIDPSTEADSSVLQVLSQLAAALLFFSFGMERQIIRVFARSLEVYPAGAYVATLGSAEAIFRLGSGMFVTGFELAMPVLALLLLIEIALALLGRINSQLQLLILAFPAKMLAAIILLAAISPVVPVLYESAAQRTLRVLFRLTGI